MSNHFARSEIAAKADKSKNDNCNDTLSTSFSRLSTGGGPQILQIHVYDDDHPPLDIKKKEEEEPFQGLRINRKEAMIWRPLPKIEGEICEETRQKFLANANNSLIRRIVAPPGCYFDPFAKFLADKPAGNSTTRMGRSSTNLQVALRPEMQEGVPVPPIPGTLSLEEYLKLMKVEYAVVNKEKKTRRSNKEWDFSLSNNDQENFEEINDEVNQLLSSSDSTTSSSHQTSSSSSHPTSSTILRRRLNSHVWYEFDWHAPVTTDENGTIDPYEGLIIHGPPPKPVDHRPDPPTNVSSQTKLKRTVQKKPDESSAAETVRESSPLNNQNNEMNQSSSHPTTSSSHPTMSSSRPTSSTLPTSIARSAPLIPNEEANIDPLDGLVIPDPPTQPVSHCPTLRSTSIRNRPDPAINVSSQAESKRTVHKKNDEASAAETVRESSPLNNEINQLLSSTRPTTSYHPTTSTSRPTSTSALPTSIDRSAPLIPNEELVNPDPPTEPVIRRSTLRSTCNRPDPAINISSQTKPKRTVKNKHDEPSAAAIVRKSSRLNNSNGDKNQLLSSSLPTSSTSRPASSSTLQPSIDYSAPMIPDEEANIDPFDGLFIPDPPTQPVSHRPTLRSTSVRNRPDPAVNISSLAESKRTVQKKHDEPGVTVRKSSRLNDPNDEKNQLLSSSHPTTSSSRRASSSSRRTVTSAVFDKSAPMNRKERGKTDVIDGMVLPTDGSPIQPVNRRSTLRSSSVRNIPDPTVNASSQSQLKRTVQKKPDESSVSRKKTPRLSNKNNIKNRLFSFSHPTSSSSRRTRTSHWLNNFEWEAPMTPIISNQRIRRPRTDSPPAKRPKREQRPVDRYLG